MQTKTTEFEAALNARFDAAAAAITASESNWQRSGEGTVYYVSPSGNDTADGLSAETAWASVAKVNATEMKQGSVVLFERGGVWNRQGTLKTKAGVIYSAYGEGAKPLFSNYVDANATADWTQVGTNLWVYSGDYASATVLAEYPHDASIPGSYITSTNYDKDTNDDIGCIIFGGGESWGVKITKTTENKSVALGTVWNGLEERTYPSVSFTDANDLSAEGSFYHDPTVSRLYLYCSENPATRYGSVRLVVRGYGVGGSSGAADGAVLDNLAIKYFGAHGVSVGSVKDFTVRNCEIGWIGGSIQTYTFGGRNYPTRFGEGIQNWGSCDGFYVQDSWLYQVYDGAVSSQKSSDPSATSTWMKDIHVTDCLFEKNTGSIEMWMSLGYGDQYAQPDRFGFEGMRVTGNLFRDLGYGFGNTRPGTAIYEDECDGFNVGDGYWGAPGQGIVDCEMTDNVMWNTRKQFFKGLYWGMEQGFKLYGNTFLAEYGSTLAMLPRDFDSIAQWDYIKYAYSEAVIADLIRNGVIGENDFYYLSTGD